jgi:hypothetical protein
MSNPSLIGVIAKKKFAKLISFAILLASFLDCHAQYALDFNGNNGCFYAGPAAASNIRTIEFWFNPAQDYGPELNDFVSLVCREGGPGPNYDEYYIAFEPAGLTHPGHIRFCYTINPAQYYNTFSEANRWTAGKWYHLAAVIHPDSGMMLFIDGIRQSGSAPFFQAAPYSSDNIAIAAWGYPPNGGSLRYFNGMIDDVRLSDNARYIEDFPVPCPNHKSDNHTIALWNLEEGSGNIATDSSSHGNHATITIGSWDIEYPCLALGQMNNEKSGMIIYPNPAVSILYIDGVPSGHTEIAVLDFYGRKLITKRIYTHEGKKPSLDVSCLCSGTYLLHIKTKHWNDARKLVIH